MPEIPVRVKLFDAVLPLPTYHSSLAAGFDFYARFTTVIPPQQIAVVQTNVALEIPADFWLLIAARSSLYKLGLQLINGVGVFDADYCGDDDEAVLIVYNFSAAPVTVRRGDRLAQGILMPRYRADFTLTQRLNSLNRGGIGSTGK